MFWDKWVPKKYLVKSEICSVELVFSDNGIFFYYTHLKSKNNKLSIVSCWSGTNKLELPKKIEKNKIPLLIIANGKGIILKKITLSDGQEQNYDAIIQANLPTINTSDFFVQLYQQKNNTAFVTLCRKEQINSVLNEIFVKKIEVANVFISSACITGLQPLWSNLNAITAGVHKVEITNDCIETITSLSNNNSESDTAIKMDGLTINTFHILGFSAGLSYLTQTKIAQTNSIELIELEEKHIEKNKLKIILIGAVFLAFIAALTNVFFYTHYFDKNNRLETELSIYQGKYEQINQLLIDYQKKKDLIENAGILNKNKLSEYADKIASTLPNEVVLTELYFNPKNEEDDSEDSLVTFYTNNLILKGNCNKSMIINDWLNVLKMQKFVKDVSLGKFSYNKEGLLPNFEIKLVTE